MKARPRTLVVVVSCALVAGSGSGQAHKPITSPYTFTEDVRPILRAHCAGCHRSEGITPMPLTTHQETVPWAESIRMELIAGHMPPWRVESGAARFRNVDALSARELNVLLTWAAGGTPPGADVPAGVPAAPAEGWRLGPPDLQLQPAAAFTLPADVQERVQEFAIPTRTLKTQWVRAVDLMPGAPAAVRAATISIRGSSTASPRPAVTTEQVLALWLPGDAPVPLDAGAGFILPAGAELTLRIHYRKTWQNERNAITDRSTVAIYFAQEPASTVQAIALAPSDPPASGSRPEPVSFKHTLAADMSLVAIYPDAGLHAARTAVHVLKPDGSREDLITFRPRPDWTRRYWLRQPLALPRGTQIEVAVETDDDAALLPPGVTPRSRSASTIAVTLNGILSR